VLLIVVSAGPCAYELADIANTTNRVSTSEITAFAILGKLVLFSANDLGIPVSLLVSAYNPGSDQ
jgi:hypothetical protein